MRRLAVALATSVLAMGAFATAHAQEVRGRLVDDATGEPLRGAIVILLGPDSRRLGGSLADDDGRYMLRATAPGTYALRVEVVGHRAVTLPAFALASGETLDRSPRLRLERVQLAAVRVTAAARCGRPDSSNAAAAMLWAEARKTLESTRLAQRDRMLAVTVENFQRDLARDSLVKNERTWRSSGQTDNPYVSLAPDLLAREGHRIVRNGTPMLIAPDANVLLSDAFVESHCFQATRDAKRARVGLTFRPEHRSSKVDVEGTLWLDGASAELRLLNFRFVTDPPSLVNSGDGLVEFARAPSGAWMVRRWVIGVPQLAVSLRPSPGAISGVRSDTTITGRHEEGGEVVSAIARGAAATSSSTTTGLSIAGIVRDSTTDAPLAGATVTVEGTRFRTRTDAEGRFAFDSLLGDGLYVIHASHPRADSLGVAIAPRSVRIARDHATAVELALPGVRAVVAHYCGASESSNAGRVLTGVVRDEAGGLPVAGALVTALSMASSADGRVRGTTTNTDDAGRYALCDLPASGDATILVHRDGRVALVRLLGAPAANGPAAIARDYTVPRDLSGALIDLRGDVRSPFIEIASDSGARVALSGVVLAPTGEVVTGARASLLLQGTAVRGDSGGVFAFEGDLTGARELRVRALGYAELAGRVRLRDKERKQVLVMLAPTVPRLATTRVRGERDAERLDPMRGFDERRRKGQGTYLDRAEIQRRGATRVTDVLRGIAGVTIQLSLAHPGQYDVIMGRSAIARPDCNTFTPQTPSDGPSRADSSRRGSGRVAPPAPVCPTADDQGGEGLRANSCTVMWMTFQHSGIRSLEFT